MSDQLKIYCENTQCYVDFQGGESLLEIAQRIGLPFRPICARVNNKTENLQFRLFSPKMVEFLDITHPSGERAYIRSLCMVLYKALTNLFEGASLRISHSISAGYYCRVFGSGLNPDQDTASKIKAEMRRIIDADLEFRYKERLTKDVVKVFKKQGLESKVKLLETTHELYCVYYKLGEVCDSYYGTLAPSTGLLRVFDLTPYKGGFLLRGFDKQNPTQVPQMVVQEKMFRAFTDYVKFNDIVGVRNVGGLNEAVIRGETATLINVAEALHNKYIAQIADDITARFHKGELRWCLWPDLHRRAKPPPQSDWPSS